MTVKELNEFAQVSATLTKHRQILESLELFKKKAQYSISEISDIDTDISEVKKVISESEVIIDQKKSDVENLISQVDNLEVRIYMRLHYLRGLTWSEVSVITGNQYGEDSVKKKVYLYLKLYNSKDVKNSA